MRSHLNGKIYLKNISKKFGRSNSFPIIILLILNFYVFYEHYLGRATFPWDFLGGYHTHSFGWYNHSNIFSHIKWFPWTSLGFPSSIAIQSGSWYIPLIFSDLLGFTYSIEIATKIQCLHVVVGSIGFYFFLKLFNFEKYLCLFGAICLHLTSLFFSNQQHVDIIRAYALLPWVLWALHPITIRNKKFSLLISSLIIFQFFVAAYPGNIISAAYCCFIYCIFNYLSIETNNKKYCYLRSISLILISSLLMSMLKWIPFAMDMPLLSHGKVDINTAPFHPIHLLTLFFYYDNAILPSDITMSGFYTPITVVFGVFFLRKEKSTLFKISISFVLIAFYLGAFLHTLYPSRIPFPPGLNISRFPLSDWRSTFQIGVIALSMFGWNNIVKRKISKEFFLYRTFLFSIFVMIMIWIAISSGFELNSIQIITIKSTLISILIFIYIFNQKKNTGNKYTLFISLIILLSIADGLYYHKNQETPWKAPWSKNIELSLYQYNIDKYRDTKKTHIDENRRGERFVLNIDNVFMNYQNNSIYNRCWYNESYCLLGYDNLKFSIPHTTIFSRLVENKKLFDFLTNPQQVLLIKEGEKFDIDNFTFKKNKNEYISHIHGASASIVSYSSDKISYKVLTPTSIQVVENEIWWNGWKVLICHENDCKNTIDSNHTDEYLRTWTVPPGNWDIYIFFKPKGLFYSYLFFFAGLFLAIISCFMYNCNSIFCLIRRK